MIPRLGLDRKVIAAEASAAMQGAAAAEVPQTNSCLLAIFDVLLRGLLDAQPTLEQLIVKRSP